MSAVPYNASFYDGQSGGSYRSAQRIVPLALDLIPAGSVLDVGCGVGTFLRVFTEKGVADVQGVDGDYVPRDRLLIDPARFLGRDLATPLDLGRRFDLAMTLEVAEHLYDDKAGLFVDNLCRHADVVLFSAAIPGQGGTHHVNEQWPSYWRRLFAERGYAAYDPFRSVIWDDGSVEYWYRQNLVLFANAQARAKFPRVAALAEAGTAGPFDLVHPVMFHGKEQAAKQVGAALNIQKTLESLCDGGAYVFGRNEDGAVTVRRV